VLVGQASALSFGAACADAAGQTEAALAMADEASALATTVGSLTILDAAQATRQNLAPGGAQRAGPLAMLTGREREIARLAATGSTSRAIAERLSLSPRTVDTHLSRIYRKLALPSRAALARLLAVDTQKTID
jgi:DNA-binding CsgD family transcriptional regulator